MSPPSPAARAASAATICLLASLGTLWLLIDEAMRPAGVRPAFVIVFALAVTASLLLHFIFIALLARRMGWPVGRVVLASVLTAPIGSIVGLVLYEWHTKVDAPVDRNPA